MLTSLQLLSSLPHLLQFQPNKNPNKTLQFQFQLQPQPQIKSLYHSTTMSSSSSSSWSCTKCTFLNPPSQKSNCQICFTPISSSSSQSNLPLSSPQKWSCKACTFLNSYSLSNCEVCDTRASLTNLDSDDPDDDFVGSSSVGSVFFPLRRCNSGRDRRVQETGDLGVNDEARTQMDANEFVDHGVQSNGVRNSGSNKRKLDDPVSENADAVSCLTGKKEESAAAVKSLSSTKDANNTEANVAYKRKLSDLGDFIERPIKADGFREPKSSRKILSVLDSVNSIGSENVRAVKTNSSSMSTEMAENKEVSNVIKILTYNVWFREDLEVHKRMQAIGDLIQLHSPDVICFQEVTPNIYVILQNSTWWKKYRCSVSFEKVVSRAYFCMQLSKLRVNSFSIKQFSYSGMGRELCVAEVEANQNKSLVVATSHLESPSPGPPNWDQFFSKERVNQAKEAMDFLQNYPNVIFCGDMNWDEKRDGGFPCGEGWIDAWEKLKPADIGWTYDTKSNKMLTGNRLLQKRLDRFICHLSDFDISCIDMIGTEAIPGLSHIKQKKLKNKIQELTLPVLPSDHYGLLLTITKKSVV